MTLPVNIVHQMSVSANAAIAQALLDGAPQMKSQPRTEPGLVAAVHLGAIPDIASAWSAPLSKVGLQVKLTGVFCHQTPVVAYQDAKGKLQRCELADFLIVVDSKTQFWSGRRAALIQAKMASKARTVEIKKGGSATQLELYQRWPLFDFLQSAYGLTAVNLKPGIDSHHSGTYGIIDRHWNSSLAPRWTQHPATPTPNKTYNHPELGEFLARMVAGESGFGRDADIGVNPTWSEVIDALLRQTLSKTFRHSQSLGTQTPSRYISAMALMLLGSGSFIVSGGAGVPPEGAFSYIEDEPTGITTLHVEVGEIEIPEGD